MNLSGLTTGTLLMGMVIVLLVTAPRISLTLKGDTKSIGKRSL